MSVNESPHGIKRTPSLTIKSRELIRECLTTTTPLRLSPGHPVIALNQEQIETVLGVVADETAKAWIDMLNSVVEKAAHLSLGSSRSKTPQPMHRSRSVTPGTSDNEAELASASRMSASQNEASEGMYSEEDFWTTGTSHCETAIWG